MTDSSETEFDQAAWLIDQRRIQIRQPGTLGRWLPRLIASTGIASQQADQGLAQAWEQVAGTEFGPHSRPGRVRHGQLEVHVRDSMTVQEITFQQTRLLAALQQALPDSRIRGLRFRVDPSRFEP